MKNSPAHLIRITPSSRVTLTKRIIIRASGAPKVFLYTVHGHFHGRLSLHAGTARFAFAERENIEYNMGCERPAIIYTRGLRIFSKKLAQRVGFNSFSAENIHSRRMNRHAGRGREKKLRENGIVHLLRACIITAR